MFIHFSFYNSCISKFAYLLLLYHYIHIPFVNFLINVEDQRSSVKTESDDVIRGRVKTEKKSETFNLLWTPEEQKR